MVVMDDMGDKCILGDVIQALHLQAEFAFAFELGGVTAIPELRVLHPFGAVAASILVVFVDQDVDSLLPNSALKDDILVEHIKAIEEGV